MLNKIPFRLIKFSANPCGDRQKILIFPVNQAFFRPAKQAGYVYHFPARVYRQIYGIQVPEI